MRTIETDKPVQSRVAEVYFVTMAITMTDPDLIVGHALFSSVYSF